MVLKLNMNGRKQEMRKNKAKRKIRSKIHNARVKAVKNMITSEDIVAWNGDQIVQHLLHTFLKKKKLLTLLINFSIPKT